jgi:hypothetical protein
VPDNSDGDGKGRQECIIRELAILLDMLLILAMVGVARMAMAYVCHLFACKLFLFSSFRLCKSVPTN